MRDSEIKFSFALVSYSSPSLDINEKRKEKVTGAKTHFSRVNFDFNTISVLNCNTGSTGAVVQSVL